MQKPAEILELEKELGFELEETKNPDDILNWRNSKTYLLNENQEVIGLNLGRCGLNDISFLTKLKDLQTLYLSANRIQNISFLAKLKNLQALFLRSNKILNISTLTTLENLQIFDLSHNQIQDISALANLQNLKELDLSYNQIQVIFALANLQNLKELLLQENRIIVFDKTFIDYLPHLEKLSLKNNPIQNIPENIFTQIIYKKVPKNWNFSDNWLDEFPDIDKKLHCYAELSHGKLEKYNLAIHLSCLQQVKDYFAELDAVGSDYLFEAKILMIGEGGAGKSSFAVKMRDKNEDLPKKDDTTLGIQVVKWDFKTNPHECGKHLKGWEKKTEIDFNVNIWDLGGQEIYRGTHQFFFSDKILYVLVIGTREDKKTFPIPYWFHTVENLGKDSKILIVINRINTPNSLSIDEESIKTNFGNLIAEIYHINLNNPDEIAELQAKVQKYLKGLDDIGKERPAYWIPIKNDLVSKAESVNFISYDELRTICREYGLSDLQKIEDLCIDFNRLGIFTHFVKDDFLKERIYLNSNWLCNTLYKLLNNKIVEESKGRITEEQFKEIWADNLLYEEKGRLVRLLGKFGLMYEIPNKNFYIVPEKLSDIKPYQKWEYEEAENVLRFVYRFDNYMPKGLLPRLIVAMHNPFIQNHDRVWHFGVNFQYENAHAEVVDDTMYGRQNRFMIKVAGDNIYNQNHLLQSIIGHFDNILSNPFKNLEYIKEIPCYCAKCRVSKTKYFDLEEIKTALELRKTLICSNGKQEVEPEKLLYGIEIGKNSFEEQMKPYFEKQGKILRNIEETQKEHFKVSKNTNRKLNQFFVDFTNFKQQSQEDLEGKIVVLQSLIDKQKPQNLNNYAQKAQIEFPKFNSLQAESQNFVAMAFYFLEFLPDSGDFSPVALQFCRALELEMKVIFDDFKNSKILSYPDEKSLFSVKEEKETFGIFYRFVEENRQIMLNQMIYTLLKINDLANSNLFSDFKNYLVSKDLTALNIEIENLKNKDYRNKSAHTQPLLKTEAQNCKNLIFQSLSLLF